MLKNIYLPLDLGNQSVQIGRVLVKHGDRIRKEQPLCHLRINNINTPFQSPHDGWIRFVAAQSNQVSESGKLLFIIDAIEVTEYRVDPAEVNPDSELGNNGRRGVERDGQKTFAADYSAELFNAPKEGNSCGYKPSVKEHPLLQNMKEGVPPKMSDAANNDPAVERTAEDASRDPELRNQLTQQLQNQLGVSSSPGASPSPKPN